MIYALLILFGVAVMGLMLLFAVLEACGVINRAPLADPDDDTRDHRAWIQSLRDDE